MDYKFIVFKNKCVPLFCPFSTCLIRCSFSTPLQFLSGSLLHIHLTFWATLVIAIEGFMWPLIVTIGNLELDPVFYFIFRLAILGTHSLLGQHN